MRRTVGTHLLHNVLSIPSLTEDVQRIAMCLLQVQQEITTFISQAHLILLLLSPDFLASEECYMEMKQAVRRADAGEAHVIPILLRPIANWKNTPIGELEPLPPDREFVSNKVDQDKAMSDIAEQLEQIIKKIHRRKEQ